MSACRKSVAPKRFLYFCLSLRCFSSMIARALGNSHVPTQAPSSPCQSPHSILAVHWHAWERRGRPTLLPPRRGHRRGRQRAHRRGRPYPPQHLAGQERSGHGSVVATVDGGSSVVTYDPHMAGRDGQDLRWARRPLHRHRVARLWDVAGTGAGRAPAWGGWQQAGTGEQSTGGRSECQASRESENAEQRPQGKTSVGRVARDSRCRDHARPPPPATSTQQRCTREHTLQKNKASFRGGRGQCAYQPANTLDNGHPPVRRLA